MVLTNEEMQVVKGVLAGLQNATGYGFDVMVRGTQLSGILSGIALIIAVASAIVCAKMGYSYSNKKIVNKTFDSCNDISPFWSMVICFVLGFIISGAVLALLVSFAMQAVAPQYTVVNNILDMAKH